MITISKGLWTIKKSEDNPLCYMAPVGENGTKKMMETGRGWGGERPYDWETRTHLPYKPGVEAEWDNEPRTGFKIMKAVSRWSTSNKVWRVMDPRGFELEIYTGNMEEIVQHSVIDHGVVQTECVWGRNAGKNILIPIDTPEYQEAVANTKMKNSKIDPNSAKPGDIVKLKNGEEKIYMGSGYPVRIDNYDATLDFKIPKSKSYLFIDTKYESDTVWTRSKFDLAEIVEAKEEIINPLAVINKKVSKGEWKLNGWAKGQTLFMIDQRSDIRNAKLVLESINPSEVRALEARGSGYDKNRLLIAFEPSQGAFIYTTRNMYQKENPSDLGKMSFRSPHYYGVPHGEIDLVKGLRRITNEQFPRAESELSNITEIHIAPNQGNGYRGYPSYGFPEELPWKLWVPVIRVGGHAISLFA